MEIRPEADPRKYVEMNGGFGRKVGAIPLEVNCSMKRLLLSILCLALLLGTAQSEAVSTGDDDDMTQAREAAERHAIAQQIYVCDAADVSYGYFTRDEHVRGIPASTTKIMTCLLALENCSQDELVTVTKEAASLGGANSLMGLVEGEQICVKDLLYGLMLPSGNDAANALAIHIDGSIEGFVERMNARAAELGLTDTAFTNPRGVNREGHYASAYDLAVLTAYAMENAAFRQIVATANYDVSPNEVRRQTLHLKNRNRLVSDAPGTGCWYEYAVGVKTGTSTAGSCLVAAATKEDVTLLCVQLGAVRGASDSDRAETLCKNAAELFAYVFDYMYAYVAADTLLSGYEAELIIENARIGDEANGCVTAKADLSGLKAYRPIRDIELLEQGDSFTTEVQWDSVTAPVAAGQTLGTVTFSYGGRVWFRAKLYATRTVLAAAAAVPFTAAPSCEASQRAEMSADIQCTDEQSPAPLQQSSLVQPALWYAAAAIAALLLIGLCATVIHRLRKRHSDR